MRNIVAIVLFWMNTWIPLIRNMVCPAISIYFAKNNSTCDYKEGYYIGVEVPKDDPDAVKPFYGPNVWPSADILPGWRQTMEEYHQQALEVAKSVARIIALALDLDADYFDRPKLLGKSIAVLRLLHYEGKISDPTKGIFGAGAHSDFGFITLLATDDVFGLQICKDKDAIPQIWEYIPPIKGAFVVNIGDMLERWSNCIFRLHILWSLITTALLNALQLANQRRLLPSSPQSKVRLTWFNDIRIPRLISICTNNGSSAGKDASFLSYLLLPIPRLARVN